MCTLKIGKFYVGCECGEVYDLTVTLIRYLKSVKYVSEETEEDIQIMNDEIELAISKKGRT